jgi:uncharacterized membrane-anchored protein YjiN (DUF445 family)
VGFHILKKTDVKDAERQTYEQVSKDVAVRVRNDKKNRRIKDFVDSLVSSARIVYADTVYRGLF